MQPNPGPVALIGSGETSLSGGRVFERIARLYPPPVRIAVLETPAGFELNSDRVAGRVAEFLRRRLGNYSPQVAVIPARRRGTPFSPDNPELLAPLATADLIFMGPGSPTYAVRQLRDSLAWRAIVARHRQGAAVVLASSAAIAAGFVALPVYEIYKVGADLHWQEGLDFFRDYGLKLAIISHWNNATGGAELDTSHCYIGRARFEQLYAMLPALTTVIGIDEHTALIMDLQRGEAEVAGRSRVTVISDGVERRFASRQRFPLTLLGPFHPAYQEVDFPAGVPVEAGEDALAAEPAPPEAVLALVERREAARAARHWREADRLREEIAGLGWSVLDTPEGPRLVRR